MFSRKIRVHCFVLWLATTVLFFGTIRARATDIRIAVTAGACPPTDVCFQTTGNTLPLQDYSQDVHQTVIASASVSADAIKLFVDSHNSGGDFVYVSFNDTYTLTGPTALMGTTTTVTPMLHLTGTMSEGLFTNTLFLGIGGVHVKVGTMQPDSPGLLEQFRVVPFAPTSDLFQQLTTVVSTTEVTNNVDLTSEAPITVTYGTPFDVAYEVFIGGSAHTIFDFSHTGKINFDIPTGAQLTSAGGYSQGVPTTPGVPEPASLVLVGSGLLALTRTKKQR